MDFTTRAALAAIIKALRDSGAIDDGALQSIKDELLRAASRVAKRESDAADEIGLLAGEVDQLRGPDVTG